MVGARMGVYTCVCVWCVSECCPTVELVNSDKRGSLYLPACSTPSFHLEDRQTGRQTALLPACQTLSPLTPTQGSQVCTWEVMNLPFPPTSLSSTAWPAPTSPQAGLGFCVEFPQRWNPWGPFAIETWALCRLHLALETSWGADHRGERGGEATVGLLCSSPTLDHAEGLRWEVGRTRIIYYPHFVDEKTEEQRCD